VSTTRRDVEDLLRSALKPVEPPADLGTRIESALEAAEQELTSVAASANRSLEAWKAELSESELRSLRDPRNWVRPAAAAAAGTAAGAALVLLGLRKRRPPWSS